MASRRRTPRPGVPVRGSRSGRPVMALLDLLGRRWALRVLWELREGPLSFRGLRDRCGQISPTVLNARLRELRGAGLLGHRRGSGYALTGHGEELLALAQPLDRFARRWARQLEAGKRGGGDRGQVPGGGRPMP